jgi:hypothetical protein
MPTRKSSRPDYFAAGQIVRKTYAADGAHISTFKNEPDAEDDEIAPGPAKCKKCGKAPGRCTCKDRGRDRGRKPDRSPGPADGQPAAVVTAAEVRSIDEAAVDVARKLAAGIPLVARGIAQATATIVRDRLARRR